MKIKKLTTPLLIANSLKKLISVKNGASSINTEYVHSAYWTYTQCPNAQGSTEITRGAHSANTPTMQSWAVDPTPPFRTQSFGVRNHIGLGNHLSSPIQNG